MNPFNNPDAYVVAIDISDDGLFIIPIDNNYPYDYNVHWRSADDDDTGEKMHQTGACCMTFKSGGRKLLAISGKFPRIVPFGNKLISVEQWGTTQWETMENAFYDCRRLCGVPNTPPDLGKCTNMQGMFCEAKRFNCDISNWDVSNVTNMSIMFSKAKMFNCDLSKWDVSNVTDMFSMFYYAKRFNGDISNWDVSKVANMTNMFHYAKRFNCDISNWDVSNVTDMTGMFWGLKSFNADISKWDVSNVTSMWCMFAFTKRFNADISNWDVSNVTNMGHMFSGAKSFDIDLSKWSVSDYTNKGSMFNNCGLLYNRQPVWYFNECQDKSFFL